jgi:hypothetical protein
MVTGVVWYLLSALSLFFFQSDIVASLRGGAPHPAWAGGGLLFAIDVVMGIWAVWLYSALVPHYGNRSATAVIVGIAWWSLKTLQSAKWAGLGLLALDTNLIALAVATLVGTLAASMAGAWLYRMVDDVPDGQRLAT